VWLLDEKGADVNATMAFGTSALHHAKTLDILNALLDHGGDPILSDLDCQLPLMLQAQYRSAEIVATCWKTHASEPPSTCKTRKATSLLLYDSVFLTSQTSTLIPSNSSTPHRLHKQRVHE